jgi:hypothetical protein
MLRRHSRMPLPCGISNSKPKKKQSGDRGKAQDPRSFFIHKGDILAKTQVSQENMINPYRIESAKEEHTMENKQVAQPTFSRVMIKGIPYYRTRIKDADGKRVSLYARTEKELVVKLAMARG